MKNEIKIKTAVNSDTLINILEDLVKSFKAGTICLEKENEFVTLTPGKELHLEIEAGKKKNKQSFSFELNWVLSNINEETVPEFKISSKEPEPVIETVEKAEEDVTQI
ncbi:Amphi-Trp domain-containing protein [Desulfonema limicola]|uniref:Amphi-Trp domain-containing protein n=1 Tax=Desulfonema limicola TaxID=45656 RepID=A0A975BDZ5_9BACT|nr:amphi-Trp domain-containing protein [Desulfonema limicola]QTA83568.1 Amphi-Trp domain-containing protein [Desulfonema limicola]